MTDRNNPFYETLDELLKAKSLVNRFNNTGQDPITNSMLYARSLFWNFVVVKIPILLRMLDKKKNKPIGFFIHLCEECLWGK